MAQLDKLLAAMVSNHATALVLEEGDAAKLEISGALRPLTKTPLSGAQLQAVMKEIADDANQSRLDSLQPVIIERNTGDGAFVVKSEVVGGKWKIVGSLNPTPPKRTARPSKSMAPIQEPLSTPMMNP